MKNAKRLVVLERIAGVVERSRQRAALTQHRKVYYEFRKLLRERIIPDYPAAMAFLDFHRISSSVQNDFGFKTIRVGQHPPLLFDLYGLYAGHDNTPRKAPTKSGDYPDFFVDKIG